MFTLKVNFTDHPSLEKDTYPKDVIVYKDDYITFGYTIYKPIIRNLKFNVDSKR